VVRDLRRTLAERHQIHALTARQGIASRVPGHDQRSRSWQGRRRRQHDAKSPRQAGDDYGLILRWVSVHTRIKDDCFGKLNFGGHGSAVTP